MSATNGQQPPTLQGAMTTTGTPGVLLSGAVPRFLSTADALNLAARLRDGADVACLLPLVPADRRGFPVVMPDGAPATDGLPAVGTTYRAPDGYLYRVRRHMVRMADVMAAEENRPGSRVDVPKAAVYDVWTPDGGATVWDGDLPEGCTIIWAPEAE